MASKKCIERLQTLETLATVAEKSYYKYLFSDRVFYVTIADAYIESCKVSLFDKHLDFMLQGKNLNI